MELVQCPGMVPRKVEKDVVRVRGAGIGVKLDSLLILMYLVISVQIYSVYICTHLRQIIFIRAHMDVLCTHIKTYVHTILFVYYNYHTIQLTV